MNWTFEGRLFDSWWSWRWQFSIHPLSFLYFSALGTVREQMLRKSLSNMACHKLYDNFRTPYRCHKRPVVYQLMIRSGVQGDVKTIASILVLTHSSFKWLERKWDSFWCHVLKQRLQLWDGGLCNMITHPKDVALPLTYFVPRAWASTFLQLDWSLGYAYGCI